MSNGSQNKVVVDYYHVIWWVFSVHAESNFIQELENIEHKKW